MIRWLAPLGLVLAGLASTAPPSPSPSPAPAPRAALADPGTPVPEGASCGDYRCEPPEDCRSCPQDCGSCCGNHRCEPPEDCRSCPQDCGGC